MKKIFLSLFLLLALATPCLAQNFKQMRLTVPTGWTSSEEGAVVLIGPKNEATISIIIEKTENLSAQTLTTYLANELKGTPPTKYEQGYSFQFKNQSGVLSTSYLFVENNLFSMLTITGNHKDLSAILKSLKGIGSTKNLINHFSQINVN